MRLSIATIFCGITEMCDVGIGAQVSCISLFRTEKRASKQRKQVLTLSCVIIFQ